jgi:diadenosine tetraphosphatase ApaH/serine/threonine PP2A family protein phosphatase
MRIAILTDVHGNLPALEAVLESIDAAAPDERWCLGDLVGYGAQPDDCTRLVSERCDVCLAGNHDLAVTADLDISDFSNAAAEAVEWTRQAAAKETIDFLRGLEAQDTSREVALYHASPRDPIWEYVLDERDARECMEVQASRVSFIGHSHVALYFRQHENGPDDRASGSRATAGEELDLSEHRWLINPGSVGQPRDADPRAAWLELDTDAWKATYHRLEYDIDRAAGAILEAGLPRQLADRLYVGI